MLLSHRPPPRNYVGRGARPPSVPLTRTSHSAGSFNSPRCKAQRFPSLPPQPCPPAIEDLHSASPLAVPHLYCKKPSRYLFLRAEARHVNGTQSPNLSTWENYHRKVWQCSEWLEVPSSCSHIYIYIYASVSAFPHFPIIGRPLYSGVLSKLGKIRCQMLEIMLLVRRIGMRLISSQYSGLADYRNPGAGVLY